MRHIIHRTAASGQRVSATLILNITSAVLAVCALVLTTVVVARAFGWPAARVAGQAIQGESVSNWREIASDGVRIGRIAAPVVIVEFADFQCPACATLHKRLLTIAERYPTGVAVVYRHYPLSSIHPHAYEAALAAECAASQGRFAAVRDALFAQQDSIGVRSWESLASVAKVADVRGFARCIKDRKFASRVDKDMVVGRALAVRGTPMLLINDRRLDGAPPLEVLDSIVHAQFRRATSATLSAEH